MNAKQPMSASSPAIAWVLGVMAIAVICAVGTAATRTSAELHSASVCETCPKVA
jgi:hypothetical protein